MLLLIITVFFLACYALLIYFFYYHWKQIRDFDSRAKAITFVSVVIAARNEAETLPRLIQDLQMQDYPPTSFEVIIVNDHSTDQTGSIKLANNMKMILPNSDPSCSSKKLAIAAGIAEAKGELILVTDADCRVGEKWISVMTAFYQEKEAAFIAAPVQFDHNDSYLEAFQSIDFLVLQGITAASVQANFMSMCNGANLAYTRKAFYEAGGFEGIDKVATGDDMLLMYKIWKKNRDRVFYLKSKEAIVRTEPMKTWRDFYMQRKRWASKSLVYDDKRIIGVLAFILLFNLLFIVLLVAGFFNTSYLWLALGFLIMKTIIEFPFLSATAKFFNERNLLSRLILFQPCHIIYTVLTGLASQAGGYEWKGRKTK